VLAIPKNPGRRAAPFKNIAVALLIAAVVAYPVASSAARAHGTVGYMLENDCSQGRAAFGDERAATDAFNMGDFRRARRQFKKASDLWYGCSKETSDQYAHDQYLLAHDQDLANASDNNSDPWIALACAQLNELAYATQFSLVRKEALKTKNIWCQALGQ